VVASARHLAEHMGEAPVLILACISTDGAPPTVATGASIYPAVQNILLSARALGIGSCLTTIHRLRDRQVKELLGIPPDVVTAALIPLGYPLRKFGRPPRRPLADVTFADRWGHPPGW
jgi:nitroreductase